MGETGTPSLFLPGPGRKERAYKGLLLLRDAWDGARDVGVAPEEFAVEVGQFRAAGLTNTDLRWLVGQGYAEHLVERGGAVSRRLGRPRVRLSITERSCFVLTLQGALLAPEGGSAGEAAPSERPRWDGRLRRLCWRGALVKQFRVAAENQVVILTALEEEDWPARIDDPLPWVSGVDPKARLHDAIKCLNRNQAQALLRFRGDGTGRGVLWAPRP